MPAVSRRRWLLAFTLTTLTPLTMLACRKPSERAEPTTPVERVASRTVFADEVLWALGPQAQAKVVGLSPMADDPRYSTVAGLWPATAPRLGRNPEELLALAPDLVILASFSEAEYRAAIEGKVRVLVLDDFSGFEGYLSNMGRIGEALGLSAEAERLRRAFVERRASIEARRPAAAARPSVVTWDHGYVPGAQTSFDDAATTAGFVNLAAREGLVGHQRIDTEQLVAWDPQWIVIGCGERPCTEAIAELAAQPGLGKLAAVGSGRVIAIEAPYLGTTGAEMLELAERMQARLLEDS